LGIEGMSEVAHFVQDAAKRPDVRLVSIGLVLEQLWRHVVRSADARVGKVLGAVEHLGDAEVSKSNLHKINEYEANSVDLLCHF
jgi:hypothetical protein